MTSPVDRKICFFGSQEDTRVSSLDQTGCDSVWSHLQEDKIWQTVLEYYYSLCNVSSDKRSQALNVYIKKRVKQKSERQDSKKSLSYAEIVHKLGIPTANPTHAKVLKEESLNTMENRTELYKVPCPTTSSSATNGCKFLQGSGSMEYSSSCGLSSNLSQNTLPMNETTEESQSDLCQTSCCSKIEQPRMSDNGHLDENSSCKSCLKQDVTSQPTFSNEIRTPLLKPERKIPRYSNVLIEMEKAHMTRLLALPSSSWNINNDLVLVHFLCEVHEKVNQGKCKVSSLKRLCKTWVPSII